MTSKMQEETNSSLAWIPEVTGEFVTRIYEIKYVYYLVRLGLELLNLPEYKKGLPEVSPDYFIGLKNLADVEEQTFANFEAILLEDEVLNHYPRIKGQIIVNLWANFEDFNRTFLVNWLRTQPDAMKTVAVQKLTVKIGEYEELEDDEKYHFILHRLERNTKGKGAELFKNLLKSLEVDIIIASDTNHDLYEFFHVRNLFAHRSGGVADQWIASKLDVEIGERLSLSNEVISRYIKAMVDYTMSLGQALKM